MVAQPTTILITGIQRKTTFAEKAKLPAQTIIPADMSTLCQLLTIHWGHALLVLIPQCLFGDMTELTFDVFVPLGLIHF
jgi:hypothetical protein